MSVCLVSTHRPGRLCIVVYGSVLEVLAIIAMDVKGRPLDICEVGGGDEEKHADTYFLKKNYIHQPLSFRIHLRILS